MDSSFGFISEMQKKLDLDISHDELQIIFFAILFLIENRKTAQMTPSVTLHLLLAKTNFKLGLIPQAIREVRFAYCADSLNLEVQKTIDWLTIQIKTNLASDQDKNRTVIKLEKLLMELEDSDLIDSELYILISNAFGRLGDANRSQCLRTKAQVRAVIIG